MNDLLDCRVCSEHDLEDTERGVSFLPLIRDLKHSLERIGRLRIANLITFGNELAL